MIAAASSSPLGSSASSSSGGPILQAVTRQPGAWTCSFCGCARNLRPDMKCKLCGRLRSVAVRRRVESAKGGDAAATPGARLEFRNAKSHVERHRFSTMRAKPNAPARGDCVVCYETTAELTWCCEQPLCSRCVLSLLSISCPVCRRDLQHSCPPLLTLRGPQASSLEEADPVDFVQAGNLHVMLSIPPMQERPGRPELPRLQRYRGNTDLAQYVDFAVTQAASLQESDGDDGATAIQSFLESIRPELERRVSQHFAGERHAATATAGVLRQLERLRRHGLISAIELQHLLKPRSVPVTQS